MPATLTIHDETSSGQKTHSFTLECLTERMTSVRAGKNATERVVSEEEALKRGMEEKSKEFVEKGAEVYAKV